MFGKPSPVVQAWHDADAALWSATEEEFEAARDRFCTATDAVVLHCDRTGRKDLAGSIDGYRQELLVCLDEQSGRTFLSIKEVLHELIGRTKWHRRHCLGALERLARSEADDIIEIVPTGFRLAGGAIESLTGKALAMLRELVAARDYRLSHADILRKVWPDGEVLSSPEQAVKDAATKLRRALREALQRMGIKRPVNPLPSVGRGADLTYQLDLSSLQQ